MARKQLILNQSRNLGDVISDGFTLVKRNFNVIGGLFLILVFPILLIGMYNLYFVFNEIDFLNLEEGSPLGMFGGVKLFMGYGLMILSFLIYYYIIFSAAIMYQRNNNESPDRYMVLGFMKENALKYLMYFFSMIMLMIGMMAITASMAMISPILMGIFVLALFFGFIYLFPILNIFPLVYLDGDIGFVDAVKETLRLIKGEWWPSFGVILITNIIGSMASYILILPVYAIMLVQMMSTMDGDMNGVSNATNTWMGILIVVSIISSTVVLIYTASGVVLKYYDLKEGKDNTSLYDKIDNLGSSNSNFFENEGEF